MTVEAKVNTLLTVIFLLSSINVIFSSATGCDLFISVSMRVLVLFLLISWVTFFGSLNLKHGFRLIFSGVSKAPIIAYLPYFKLCQTS